MNTETQAHLQFAPSTHKPKITKELTILPDKKIIYSVTKLFEDKERTEHRPAWNIENQYDFYDNSNSELISQIRDTLNDWYKYYPDSEKSELKKRLQTSFSSAFYELFLHEFFRRQGFVLEPHPILPNTTKRPDFLVCGHGLEFYLEAKESTGQSKKDSVIEKTKNQLFDQIDKIKSPNFYFIIEELVLKGTNQPNGNKVIKYIESKLPEYDYDKLAEIFQQSGLNNLETIEYEDYELKLLISLNLKSPMQRDKGGSRTICEISPEVYYDYTDSYIKSSIEKKATRYGVLDKPYLICVNLSGEKGNSSDSIMNAVFGNFQISSSTNSTDNDVSYSRAKDGIFLNSIGPKFTRVSAILITNVRADNLDVAKHWFIQNPFARKNLPVDCFDLSKVIIENNQMQISNGKSIREILGLPSYWFKYP